MSNNLSWNKYFIYIKGDLIWKYRPLSLFKNKAGYVAANKLSGCVSGSIVTSKNSATSYKQTELFGSAYKNHRIIWEMHHEKIPKNMMIDHIDGNGLNNNIENLRIVNSTNSSRNLPMQKSNTSGVVGVCWHSSARKWQARIVNDGKRIDLGRFVLFSDAVIARKDAEILFGYHKNHGRINNEAETVSGRNNR